MSIDELIASLRDRADCAEDACRADGDDEVYRKGFEQLREAADTLARYRDALTPSAETKAANINLVAAAPELYEALDALVRLLDLPVPIKGKAGAALAKARGETA